MEYFKFLGRIVLLLLLTALLCGVADLLGFLNPVFVMIFFLIGMLGILMVAETVYND